MAEEKKFLGKGPDFWRAIQGMGEGFAGRGPQWQAAQARQKEAEAYAQDKRDKEHQAKVGMIQSDGKNDAAFTYNQLRSRFANGTLTPDVLQEILPRHLRGMAAMGGNRAALGELVGLMRDPETSQQALGQYLKDMEPVFGGESAGYESIVTGEDGNRYGLVNGQYQQIPSPEGVRFSGSGVTVNTGNTQSALGEAVEGVDADSYKGIVTQAQSARDQIALLDPLLKMDVSTGYGEQAKGTAARIAGLIAGPEAAQRIADLPAQEAFTSLSETLVNETLNQAKGPQTDQDAIRVRSTMASLGKTPEANKFILGYAYGVQRRKIDRAMFFRDNVKINEDGSNNFREVESQWNQFIESTPLVSGKLYKSGTRIPMTYYDFEQAFREKNPDAPTGAALEAWRDVNG